MVDFQISCFWGGGGFHISICRCNDSTKEGYGSVERLPILRSSEEFQEHLQRANGSYCKQSGYFSLATSHVKLRTEITLGATANTYSVIQIGAHKLPVK